MTTHRLRSGIVLALIAVLTLSLVGLVSAGLSVPVPPSSSPRVARIVHITDTHCRNSTGDWVLNELVACLQVINEMNDPPDLIIHTGDIIDDALVPTTIKATEQVNLWYEAVVTSSCFIPIRYTCGNHEILGWGWSGGDPGDEPLFGKAFFENFFESNRYYSFDVGNWHVIVLDSFVPRTLASPLQYSTRLDDEQFAWLTADLASTSTEQNVMITSHAPIMSAVTSRVGYWGTSFNPTTGRLETKDNAIHMDVARINSLLDQHPNVQLALNGHIHIHEDLLDGGNGIHHISGGAVCGYWWNVPNLYLRNPPMFGVVDLFEDGTFAYQRVSPPGPNYSWQDLLSATAPAELTLFEAD